MTKPPEPFALVLFGATGDLAGRIGGEGDDILIGGTTGYDTNMTQLQAISAYWTGPDSFDTRVTNLTTGNGVPALNDDTVFGNGGGNTLTGGEDRNLFFAISSSEISDWEEGMDSFIPVV